MGSREPRPPLALLEGGKRDVPLRSLEGNAIALRRIQKVHVIMMCAFFVLHF